MVGTYTGEFSQGSVYDLLVDETFKLQDEISGRLCVERTTAQIRFDPKSCRLLGNDCARASQRGCTGKQSHAVVTHVMLRYNGRECVARIVIRSLQGAHEKTLATKDQGLLSIPSWPT